MTTRMMTLTMMVMPGGLLVLAAWILARTIAQQMQREQGHGGRRLARAVVAVRLRDVWTNARRSFR